MTDEAARRRLEEIQGRYEAAKKAQALVDKVLIRSFTRKVGDPGLAKSLIDIDRRARSVADSSSNPVASSMCQIIQKLFFFLLGGGGSTSSDVGPEIFLQAVERLQWFEDLCRMDAIDIGHLIEGIWAGLTGTPTIGTWDDLSELADWRLILAVPPQRKPFLRKLFAGNEPPRNVQSPQFFEAFACCYVAELARALAAGAPRTTAKIDRTAHFRAAKNAARTLLDRTRLRGTRQGAQLVVEALEGLPAAAHAQAAMRQI